MEKGYFPALDLVKPISKEAKMESMKQLIEKTIDYITKVLSGKSSPDCAFGRELTRILAEKKDHLHVSQKVVFYSFFNPILIFLTYFLKKN